ncbi:MAG: DUF3352 domain-containing protein [Sporichthyaceae bacterium]|nr:DUF3352 domain-containing protein [Sporichthyaceae bacterium]
MSTSQYTDVLAAHDNEEPPRRPGGWLVIAGAAALVLALVAGVTYGFRLLSGGGTQPEEALPAGAFAFAEIDLDPSVDQKVDGFRFLRQFPALADKLSGDDLRKIVFEAVADDAGWGDIDYAAEVEPWLGQRLAVAAYPASRFGSGSSQGDGEAAVPTVVVALQVTDAGRAQDGLELLAKSASDGSDGSAGSAGYLVAGDYALIAETPEIAQRVVDAAGEEALTGTEHFTADMSGLDGGFASAWIDMSAAGGAAGLMNPLSLGAVGSLAGVTTAAGSTGRAAYVARFDGADAIEVAGRFTDAEALDGVETATLTGLGELPASTIAAFGLAGGDQLVAPMWDSLRKQMDAAGSDFDKAEAEAEQSLGMKLPEDLEAVLGSNLLAALDADGLTEGRVEVGVLTTTDPDRAAPIIDRMARLLQEGEPGVRAELTEDGYVVASSGSMLRRLTAGGTLGDIEAFRRALPDADDARMALWLDVEPLVQSLTGAFDGSAEVDPNLAPLAGFGMTVSTQDGGSGEFRLRLVTN